jgi:DNA-binding CsgD family transcriptional regulator
VAVARSHYRKRTTGELTARQRDVLALMARGKTNREIGEALGISLDGAKFHVSEILAALGVDSREEAVAAWRERGSFRSRTARMVRGFVTASALRWTASVAGLAVGVIGIVAVALVIGNASDDEGASPVAAEPQLPTGVAATPNAPSETQVIRYAPDGRLAGPEVNGTCYLQSLAAWWRTDAWRCFTKDASNQIFDPCFTLNGASVVCGMDPAAGKPGFVLRLQQAGFPDAVLRENRGAKGWLLRLADGATCIPATGASGSIEGKRANYLCSDGRWLLGDLEQGPVWKVDVVELGPASAIGSAPTVVSRETVAIETVWQ